MNYNYQDLLGAALPDYECKPVNVASVPQRSPFRYPGGKTWFIPRLRDWLMGKSVKPRILIEPFAGGGIVSLTTAFEGLTDSVIMVEMDAEIAAVWDCIFSGESEWLAKRILDYEMSRESALATIQNQTSCVKEKAFKTIVKNRTFHGGILAQGAGILKNGESGKGVHSRWYPATLAKRIRDISLIKNRVTFIEGNAFDVMAQYRDMDDVVFFIDPPYTAGGKNAGSRLYTHSVIDHDQLFADCAELVGDFIMTYDNTPDVRNLAVKYGFQAKPIPMKNTHHAEMTELVISKNLDWMNGVLRLAAPEPQYMKKNY